MVTHQSNRADPGGGGGGGASGGRYAVDGEATTAGSGAEGVRDVSCAHNTDGPQRHHAHVELERPLDLRGGSQVRRQPHKEHVEAAHAQRRRGDDAQHRQPQRAHHLREEWERRGPHERS